MSADRMLLSVSHDTNRIAARKDKIMSNRRIFSALGDLFTTFGSAVAASRRGSRPQAARGRPAQAWLDPAVFDRIGRI
ncbi:hypothetical protein [Mesorhizobium sp. B2-4-14]|uniref:hypothetical protein n=1 Tax=Mesorhizobium sp. B2-4-14 TaxID=2589935 RepID=UPI0015E31AEC|nr:hypothetical protein [Mesorhizobium sp. B2-4-14]